MSNTSLWEIDKNWSGNIYAEYKNAWLFPPVVWDILMCKYISKPERTDMYRTHTSFMTWCGFSAQANERHGMLNERINNSEIQYDRVLWELSNLSVFNFKDRGFVAECIDKFIEENSHYYDNGIADHIKERFAEIANDIRGLPESCCFFVIHPTSVDDNVEWWFKETSLSSWDKFVCEFTLIEDNKVIGFSDNLAMCKGEKQ